MRNPFRKAPTPAVERHRKELVEINGEQQRLTRLFRDGLAPDDIVEQMMRLSAREKLTQAAVAQAEEDEQRAAEANAAENERKSKEADFARRKSAVDAHAAQGRRQLKAARDAAVALNEVVINIGIFCDAASKRNALRPEPFWGGTLLPSGELLMRVVGDYNAPFSREIARLAHKHGVIGPVLGVDASDFDPAALPPISELVADMVKTCDAIAREQLLGVPAVGTRPPERAPKPPPAPRPYRRFVPEIERVDLQQRTGQSRAAVDKYFDRQWIEGDVPGPEVKQAAPRPDRDATPAINPIPEQPTAEQPAPAVVGSYTLIDAAAEMRAESRKLEFGDDNPFRVSTPANTLVTDDELPGAVTAAVAPDASATSESSVAPPPPADAAVTATPTEQEEMTNE